MQALLFLPYILMLDRLRKKAQKHNLTNYHIIAIGFSRKGNKVGMMMNMPAPLPKTWNTHAECRLMLRYGRRIKKILLLRFGNGGEQLPISPCESCKKLADSLGIKIEVGEL